MNHEKLSKLKVIKQASDICHQNTRQTFPYFKESMDGQSYENPYTITVIDLLFNDPH